MVYLTRFQKTKETEKQKNHERKKRLRLKTKENKQGGQADTGEATRTSETRENDISEM